MSSGGAAWLEVPNSSPAASSSISTTVAGCSEKLLSQLGVQSASLGLSLPTMPVAAAALYLKSVDIAGGTAPQGGGATLRLLPNSSVVVDTLRATGNVATAGDGGALLISSYAPPSLRWAAMISSWWLGAHAPFRFGEGLGAAFLLRAFRSAIVVERWWCLSRGIFARVTFLSSSLFPMFRSSRPTLSANSCALTPCLTLTCSVVTGASLIEISGCSFSSNTALNGEGGAVSLSAPSTALAVQVCWLHWLAAGMAVDNNMFV